MTGKRKILVAVVVLGVVGLLATVGWLWSTGALSQRPFDAPAWRADVSGPNAGTVRENMAADLIEQHALMGMTRTEVIELLGPPDAGAEGTEVEWTMRSASLYVRLDADGCVTSVFERMWYWAPLGARDRCRGFTRRRRAGRRGTTGAGRAAVVEACAPSARSSRGRGRRGLRERAARRRPMEARAGLPRGRP